MDPDRPITQGAVGVPEYYMESKYDVQKALENAEGVILKINKEYSEKFGRVNGNGLIEEYNLENAKTVFVAMGSICGTIKEVIDRLKEKGEEYGLLRIITYRPLPTKHIKEALKNAENIAILDKNIILGMDKGALFVDLAQTLKDKKTANYIIGLGGRDIKPEDIEGIIKHAEKAEDGETKWVGLNQ
jgi:pyruvate ferredoxin oxidoreductase alpha subunit